MSHIGNTVDELLKKFSKQEFRDFRYFISRRNNHAHERKDLKYISDVRENRPGTKGKNDIHQTKKRLKKQMEQFVQLENIRFDVTSLSFNYIETATYLFRKQMPEHAWQYLLKAEANAILNEDYVVLSIIYYMQIAYSSNIYGLDLPLSTFNKIIEKRTANRHLSTLDANANAAYAEIKYKIRALDHSSRSRTDIQEIIDSTIQHYQLTDKLYAHPRIYGKIVNIVCRGLAEIGAYRELARYSIHSYWLIREHGIFASMHPDYLNELLLSMCQSQLSTGNYALAYSFLGIYKKQSQVFRHRYDKYSYHQFMQSLIEARIMLCMGQLDVAEDIVLSTLRTYAKNSSLIAGFENIYLELLTQHFCQHDMDRCIRLYNKVVRESASPALAKPLHWQSQKFLLHVYGLICYMEINDDDYAFELLQKIRRDHKKFLKAGQYTHYSRLMHILEQLIKDPAYRYKNSFKSAVQQFTAANERIHHNEHISLNAWLLSLSGNKTYYECFLEEIHKFST